ncbi:MAG TPA: PEP-CTERM sorting domain-containing protein [Acidobacteriaceae bacterium]
MKTHSSKCLPFFARLNQGARVGGFRRATLLLAVPVIAGTLCISSTARADEYGFSVTSTTGISASGVLEVSPTGPFGAYTVNGISGNFTDSANHISGPITGLNYAPPPATDGMDTYFSPPAFTNPSAGYFSYDNLFWPGGNSPAVCVEAPVFFGGDFDIYGLSFNLAGGYAVDLWSDGALGGYQLNDSLNGVPFSIPDPMTGTAYAVDFSAAPAPEPGSLLLLGSGMTGLFSLLRRKRSA